MSLYALAWHESDFTWSETSRKMPRGPSKWVSYIILTRVHSEICFFCPSSSTRFFGSCVIPSLMREGTRLLTKVLYYRGVGLKIENPCDHVHRFSSSLHNTNAQNLGGSLNFEMLSLAETGDVRCHYLPQAWAEDQRGSGVSGTALPQELDRGFFCLDPGMHVQELYRCVRRPSIYIRYIYILLFVYLMQISDKSPVRSCFNPPNLRTTHLQKGFGALKSHDLSSSRRLKSKAPGCQQACGKTLGEYREFARQFKMQIGIGISTVDWDGICLSFVKIYLGAGFQYVLFSPLLGEMIQFENYFSDVFFLWPSIQPLGVDEFKPTVLKHETATSIDGLGSEALSFPILLANVAGKDVVCLNLGAWCCKLAKLQVKLQSILSCFARSIVHTLSLA